MATANRDQSAALSVAEMLRIMDVATAFRQDRQLVEEQLNIDEIKALLREKMIAAAKVTGEEISPAEVDAAIDEYYSRLYIFKEPPNSLMLTLAHLYVRRVAIAVWGSVAIGAFLLAWSLFLSPRGAMTAAGKTHKRVEAIAGEIAKREAAIKALPHDSAASTELAALAKEAAIYRGQEDPQKLEAVRASLDALEARLSETYTVTIASPVGGRSAIQRMYEDKQGKRHPRFYVIVEAKRADGTVLKRRIHNVEKNRDVDANIWAEQVPKEVYDRLLRDKKEDGILDETTYAVKKRGVLDETVTMPGFDGQPLRHLSQITEW